MSHREFLTFSESSVHSIKTEWEGGPSSLCPSEYEEFTPGNSFWSTEYRKLMRREGGRIPYRNTGQSWLVFDERTTGVGDNRFRSSGGRSVADPLSGLFERTYLFSLFPSRVVTYPDMRSSDKRLDRKSWAFCKGSSSLQYVTPFQGSDRVWRLNWVLPDPFVTRSWVVIPIMETSETRSQMFINDSIRTKVHYTSKFRRSRNTSSI